MRGIEERWVIYGFVGEVFTQWNFISHISFENAVKHKRVLEEMYPDEGPYLLVVYFLSKVTGQLVQGTLEIDSINRKKDLQ